MKTVLTLFIIVVCYKYASCYMRVCYYTNWSQYRPNGGKYLPEQIDPNLCSHIIYAFGKLEGNALVPFEWNDDSTEWSTGMYAKVNNLKVINPNLKTLLATGGWNAGSLPFSDMVATKASRKQFINSTLHYLRKRNFDGLDMDWEYPAKRGGRPEDKANLVLLFAELMQAFEHESYHTGRPRLLLSAAVPAGKTNIDAGYDIPNVARNLDFINIMTYDLHGSWEPVTGHNSPLFGRTGETTEDAMLNMEWAVNYWTRKGAPKHKLVVGLGLYGRSFKLQTVSNNGIGAPVIGAGEAGKYTREPGFLSYYEVCEELKKGATRVWQAEHRTPYLYNGDLWVGYDDEESVRAKVRWMKQKGFGGIMIWSLALDDFSGTFCNKGPYPLLTAINVELGHIGSPTQPKSSSVQKRSGTLGTSQSNTLAANNNIRAANFVEAIAHIMTPPPPTVPITNSNTLHESHQNMQLNPVDIPTPPAMMASNSGNMAAAAAIGELLLQGKANLNPPRSRTIVNQVNQPKIDNTLQQRSQNSGGVVVHNAAPPPIIAAGPITAEFVHGSHGGSTGTHHSVGNAGDVSIVATNNHISGHGSVPSNHQTHHSVGHLDIVPSSHASNHHGGSSIGHIAIQPLQQAIPAEPTPTFTIQNAAAIQPETIFSGSNTVGISPGNAVNSPVVVGTLPVVDTAVVSDFPASAPVSGLLPTSDLAISSVGKPKGGTTIGNVARPVAAAAHSDIGLRSVRPAPPSKPNVNFSFSSSSTSNSSSSSSSSSSKSESRNIDVGSGTLSHSNTAHDPTLSLQELLQGGQVDIHPVAVKHHDVSSVVDQNQGIVPGGTVEAVIPIDNINSLAQVLASLDTNIPTAGSVLTPEPRNEISPSTVLRELDIGNILGSNIATPVQVTLAPPRRPTRRRTISPRLTETRRIDPRMGTINRQVLERLRAEQLRRRSSVSPSLTTQASPSRTSLGAIRTSPSSVSRRQPSGNPVTVAQLRGLISVLGRSTVRDLFLSGRIRLSPTVQSRQIIRSPVTRTRIRDLRDDLIRRQQLTPSRRTTNTNTQFSTSSLLRPRGNDRNVVFLSGDSRLPTTRRTVGQIRPRTRDSFSSFGFV